MLHVGLLGPFSATFDDGGSLLDVTPTTGRERMALATLALAAPAAISAERLAGTLYGDREVSDPRNAVQAVVSRVRKALGPASGRLETTPSGYRLVDVDVDTSVMEARRDAGDIEGALALWRGPTLAGIDAGARLDGERTRLDELRATLTEQLLRNRLDADPASCVADLEAAVAEAPLREHRWELLMLALYQCGRQADALRAFQRARTHLGSELGLEPGAALIELEARILAHDQSLAVSPTTLQKRPVALPTGIVTVLLCDVEGSVRHWESRATDTAALIESMHQRWREAIGEGGGAVVKSTGDGVLALFSTASDALRAAADAQRRQIGTGLRVRAAVHTGEVISVDDDVRGPTVNRAARLLDLAHGDQILLSGVTAEVARRSIADDEPELALRSLGAHWLRDVAEPVDVLQLVGEGLPATFPPLRSSGPSHLPRLRNSLLGRERQREELVALAADEHLVTVLGTGGIGKTSLALSAGWMAADTRPVTFVDLAPLQDPDQVAGRIAETLVGADPNTRRSAVERIADRLGANPDLLIIDNAEHLLDRVAAIVDEILETELKGTLMITSRHPLAVAGERLFTVPPLTLPGANDDLSATRLSPSVQLFVERMRVASPAAMLPDGLLPVVAHICRRLDGIPLAIELAAGRTALLAVEDIAARLDDQLRLLRQVPATRDARHASLGAVTRWSLDQLSLETRRLFGCLSVMAGAFDVAGVEAIATGAGLDPRDVLDGLSDLLAASLLAAEPGTGRFRMLEPIRQVALAELQADSAGGESVSRRAHAEWMTERANAAHLAQDERRRPLFRTFDADADQLISAIRWSTGQLGGESARPGDPFDLDHRVARASELAFSSAFWFLEQDPGTGTSLLAELQQQIDRVKHPMPWARATIAWTIVTATLPVADAGADALEAVAIFDANDDPERGAARLGAIFAQFATQDMRARQLLAEADRLIPSDDRWTRAIVDLVAMMIEAAGARHDPPAGSVDEAILRGERAASALRQLDDRWALGAALGELGRLHRGRGDLDLAAASYHESIDLFGDVHYHGLHYILSELGHLASLQANHDEARRLHERALKMAADDGNAGCRAQALVGSARSELLAGETEKAVELIRQAEVLHPDWELLGHGIDALDEQLRELAAQPTD